jgi:serine protease Do
MQRQNSIVKQFVLLFLTTLAAFWVVIKLNLAGRVVYSMEKARIEAMRDALPTPEQAAAASNAARRLAEVVAPAVVSITTEQEVEVVRKPNGWSMPEGAEPPDEDSTLWKELERFLSPSPSDSDEERESDDADRDEQSESFLFPSGIGSGFVVDAEEGYVLTNRHVVEAADAITVHLPDGRDVEAELVGSDPRADVALLRVDAPRLIALPLGDSMQTQVGDDVYAVGNAFGFGCSFSRGIVSAKNRSGVPLRGIRFQRFIQTDAVINPGNSGGPLVNVSGQAVGINTAIASPTGNYGGVGFAIPSSRIHKLLPRLASGEAISYGYLGIMMRDIEDEERGADKLNWSRPEGVVVWRLLPDGPAAKAGLEELDIFMEFDGQEIRTMDDVRELVGYTDPGTIVTVKVWRESRPVEMEIEIGTLPADL